MNTGTTSPSFKKELKMRPAVRTVSKTPCSAKTREELCAWSSVSPLGCYRLRNSPLVVGKSLHISSSSSHGHKILNGCHPSRSFHGSEKELQESQRVSTTRSNFHNVAKVLFSSSHSCHCLTEEVSRERVTHVTHSRVRWRSQESPGVPTDDTLMMWGFVIAAVCLFVVLVLGFGFWDGFPM